MSTPPEHTPPLPISDGTRWTVDPSALIMVMKRRQITGPELARAARVSLSLVRGMRNGSYTVTRGSTLAEFCRILGCDPELIAAPCDDGAL